MKSNNSLPTGPAHAPDSPEVKKAITEMLSQQGAKEELNAALVMLLSDNTEYKQCLQTTLIVRNRIAQIPSLQSESLGEVNKILNAIPTDSPAFIQFAVANNIFTPQEILEAGRRMAGSSAGTGGAGGVKQENLPFERRGYNRARPKNNAPSTRPPAPVNAVRRTRYVRGKGFYEETYNPKTGETYEERTIRTTEEVQGEGWAREFKRQREEAEAKARYIAAGYVLRGYNEGGRDDAQWRQMEAAKAVGGDMRNAPRAMRQASAAHAAYINAFNQSLAMAGVPQEFQSTSRSDFELEDVRNFGGYGSPEGARRGSIRNSANYQVMLSPTSFPEPTRERQAAIRPRLEALRKETDEIAARFLDSFAPFMPEGADPHKVKWMVDDGYREVEDGRVYQFKHEGEIWGIVVKRDKDGTTKMQSDAMPYGIIQNILRPSDPAKSLKPKDLEAYGFTPDEIRDWMKLQKSDLSKASVLMQPRNRALLEKYGFADQISALMDTDMSLTSKAEKITEIFKKTKFCKNDAKRAVLMQLFKNNRFSTAQIDDFVDDPDEHRLELEVV